MKKAVHEGLLFSCCQKAAQKHGWYPIYNLISKDFLFRLTVISIVAGQPTIGKPLIGQARGQLQLIWRSYAGPPQSGEIILQNGASSWLLKLLNCKRIMMAAPFYWRGAFLYKTNAYNLWFQL